LVLLPARNMKCAAVFIFVSLVLASESFGVLRPQFPIKPMPPFQGDMIVIGDDISSPKAAPVTAPR
jgi:hypothetical protein